VLPDDGTPAGPASPAALASGGHAALGDGGQEHALPGGGGQEPAAPGDGGDESAAWCPRRRPLALLLLLAAQAAWAGWFVYRTSFVISGRRLFCLWEDAMISMTYARNLVEGYGLNWARFGQPVEGFTHPLWMALLVPVNLLRLAPDRRCLVVQLGSLALLMLHVVLVRRLVLRHFTRPGACHWLPACVLTAFYYPLDFWALMGMESGLQAVLLTASVLLALDIVHGRRDRHLALWLVSTLAVLLRMDMAPLVVVAQVYVLALGGLRQGERPDRRGLLRYPGWLLGAVVMALAVGGYSLFRWFYFHDLLPNTYYLKLAGVPLVTRLRRGETTLLASWRAHGPLLVMLAIGLLAGLASRRPRSREARELAGRLAAAAGPAPAAGGRQAGDAGWKSRLVLPAVLFLTCCAYSLYVGGDVWEEYLRANRFVAFAMPMLFVLFNGLANQAMAALSEHFAATRPPPAACPVAGPAGGPAPGRREPLLLRLGLVAVTFVALLAADGLLRRADAADNWLDVAVAVPPFEVHARERMLRRVLRLRAIADPGAVVAVVWAGIPAYFSDYRMVDELGYNDRHIAHGPPAMEIGGDSWRDFRPGHVKWDYPYVVNTFHPDVVFQFWVATREEGHAVLRLLYGHHYRRTGDMWVRAGSPRIHLGNVAWHGHAAALGAPPRTGAAPLAGAAPRVGGWSSP
jgi:hypothetical protein